MRFLLHSARSLCHWVSDLKPVIQSKSVQAQVYYRNDNHLVVEVPVASGLQLVRDVDVIVDPYRNSIVIVAKQNAPTSCSTQVSLEKAAQASRFLEPIFDGKASS